MKIIKLVLPLICVCMVKLVSAAPTAVPIPDYSFDALRSFPINQERTPAPWAPVMNTDRIQVRAFPMQPPLVPHSVRGMQENLNANQCLYCHGPGRIGQSQAPMISVTHFMDRDQNFLATVSPLRYFCLQCHVVQHDALPLVGNTYINIRELLKAEQAKSGKQE